MFENRKNRSLISFEEIIKRYLSLETTVQIARVAGISSTRVYKILKDRGIQIRNAKEAGKIKRKINYEEVIDDYKRGLFLSRIAKKYNIGDSHALKILESNGIKSRGREGIRRGSSHPMWKGGKTHDRDGYIIQKKGRTHRIVMEEKIGRKLNNWEDVHHIDGNKRNYDIINLVILPSREHIRFHTFLRQLSLETNRENLERFCRQESDSIWRFTREDLIKQSKKVGLVLKSINNRKRKICRLKGCEKQNVGRKLCSMHYQRYRAKKMGYWKSGGDRKTRFLGKFVRTNTLQNPTFV